MSVRHNLPNQISSFIGRDLQTREIGLLMMNNRLLTLTGSGGCGKTRLGLEVAYRLVEKFPDGVWWVEFPPFTGAMVVPQSIFRVMGVREEPGRSLLETLKESLQSRELLLVLDNCEHLVDSCAHFAQELLQACSHLRILATSREPLNVEGEVAWRVPSLRVPDPNETLSAILQSEAVCLFSERARRAVAGFSLTEENAPTVANICQRLDGMPLAIELAAARTRGLSLEQIEARLDDRFRLLTSGFRTAPMRHQTLRATIDWSYDLLSQVEQTLLRRLSVFAGGWTLESAEGICGGAGVDPDQVLDLMLRLVDKSLILVDEGKGERRYAYLETIRQYALEKLLLSTEIQTIRKQHCEWFLGLAERMNQANDRSKINDLLGILETEDENLHAALNWALENRQDMEALRFGKALWYCWVQRGYFRVGIQFMERILDFPHPPQPALAVERASVLIGASILCGRADEHIKSKAWAREAFDLANWADQPLIAAQALRILGGTNLRLGFISEAITNSEQALELARNTGDQGEIAQCLSVLGSAYVLTSQLAGAKKLFEEALLLFRLRQDEVSIAETLSSLGEVTYWQGNYTLATEKLQESLRVAQSQSDHHSSQLALRWLAYVARAQGNYSAAAELAGKELSWVRERGDRLCTAYLLYILGWSADSDGDQVQAEALCTQSLKLCEEVGSPSRIALVKPRLGEIALSRGSQQDAETYFKASLTWSRLNGARAINLENLAGYARLACLSGQMEKAVKLLAAIESARNTLGIPIPPSDLPGVDLLFETIRSQLAEDNFRQAWVEGQLMSLEQANELALNDLGSTQPVRGSEMGHLTNRQIKLRYDGLTAREREIATLVAQGKSNREIADDLVLSENTIASHIGNILSKLGFNSRTQIAVWATEKGLNKAGLV